MICLRGEPYWYKHAQTTSETKEHSDNLKPQDEANFARSTEEGNSRGARGP